jgi:signal transduction histidine kinase/DNA-binding response OmpR family regulator
MDNGEKAKILVVDDLQENLLVYQAILEELGQEIVRVRSGEEALKEVLRHDFAVILLDVNMPGLNGLETAALIRARKKSSHTPIIFLTAYTDEIRAAEGYAHGAVDFISSPVIPAILRAKVKVFVDLFQMTEQVKRHAEDRIAHAHERSKREAAEEANRRLSFLARAGAIITKSLNREVTIESILRLLVPEHANQAILAERDPAGRWRAVWARPDEQSAILHTTESWAQLPDSWRHLIERAAAVGVAEPPLVSPESNGEPAEYLLALPLRERERVFSVLLLVRDAAGGAYASADITMFESIAWRSAIAMVNAHLYEEIEEADQQKNRFLSMLAHELRNPLAPIRSAVDVLRLCGQSQDEIDWARDVIDRQVTHLVRLVDDLLDISRITLGKIRLVLEPLDAADLVTAAVEISQPLIEKNSHRLTLEVPDEPVSLTGDRARLIQVLANLLNNAAKYTPPGGAILMSLLQDGEDAVFRIRDSGIGIPHHMLEKVFDMFIQIENSLDRAHGGLGIGLTLVRELVSMHQGSITVTSDGPGCGSEFTVRIPCSIPALPGAAANPDRAASRSALRT